jgi:hypothetical protein
MFKLLLMDGIKHRESSEISCQASILKGLHRSIIDFGWLEGFDLERELMALSSVLRIELFGARGLSEHCVRGLNQSIGIPVVLLTEGRYTLDIRFHA